MDKPSSSHSGRQSTQGVSRDDEDSKQGKNENSSMENHQHAVYSMNGRNDGKQAQSDQQGNVHMNKDEDDEDDMFDFLLQEETKLARALNKIRRMYSNTIMTGEGDRIGFETLLSEVDTIVVQNEQKKSNEIEMLRTDLAISNRERDMKIKDWRARYDKLQDRWSECMMSLDRLQEEKEALRKQRDQLLLNKKGTMRSNTPTASTTSSINDRRELFLSLLKSMLEALVLSLSAVTATLFIHNPKDKELESLAIVCPPSIDDEYVDEDIIKKIPDVIRISARDSKSIVGSCFSTGDFLNVFDVQKDERFFKGIDERTGFNTKIMLCFPILSMRNNSVVGVVEVINKRNNEPVFSVQDEARLAEFTMTMSRMMETPGLKDIGFDHTLLGLATGLPDENHDNDSGRVSLKRMISFLEVKRTKLKNPRMTLDSNGNQSDFIMNESITAIQGKPQSLVPKDIDNYIKKLEMCWRKAVGESAQFQNRIIKLEKELYSKQSLKFNSDKSTLDLNSRVVSLEKELLKLTHEFSVQREKWSKKEAELKTELEMTQKTNQKLLVEHAKLGNEEIIKNVMVPSGSIQKTVELPYIDLKSQKKKIILSVGGSPQTGLQDNDIHRSNPDLSTNMREPTNTAPNTNDSVDQSTLSVHHLHSKNFHTSNSAPVSRSKATSARELYMNVFMNAPNAMCILTKSYRIWRVNDKFCDMLDCTEQNLLGLSLSDISIGVDLDTLPRLLQFDIVQGLGLCRPKGQYSDSGEFHGTGTPTKKLLFKVNVQISKVGSQGQKYQTTQSKPGCRTLLTGPFFVLNLIREINPARTGLT